MCMCEAQGRSPPLSCLKHLLTQEDLVRSGKAQVHFFPQAAKLLKV